MITAGIVGGAGYVAGELLRCLVHHPSVKLDFVYSTSQSGHLIDTVHQDLLPHLELEFSDSLNENVDVVFLCLGHGKSKEFLENNKFSSSTKIIDLSNDFRLKADSNFNGMPFVYGLVELNKDTIKTANYIANPGCFATAIQLALLPLAANGLLRDDVHAHAITGSTGAGQSLSATTHFSWRNNNVSIYKAFSHQHLGEIGESVKSLQNDFDFPINFIPVRGNFTRGILASVYTACDIPENELVEMYQTYYSDACFTHVSSSAIHLKQVVNTNNAFLQVQQMDGKILVTSVIDNLLKGAAGQAIQNMNLMFGLAEETGLNFKANYF